MYKMYDQEPIGHGADVLEDFIVLVNQLWSMVSWLQLFLPLLCDCVLAPCGCGCNCNGFSIYP